MPRVPPEPMYRAVQGSNFGWPYCFYDYGQKKLLLNPEYGGDGKTVGRCSEFLLPVASFPAHWAPVDVMFYSGTQFPAHYKGGAFIAFHGSWNRAPMPQDGYNVTFQPFVDGKPSGGHEIFANGFAGKSPLMNPNDAVARADGVAQAADGSLYITDSQKGKIWQRDLQGREIVPAGCGKRQSSPGLTGINADKTNPSALFSIRVNRRLSAAGYIFFQQAARECRIRSCLKSLCRRRSAKSPQIFAPLLDARNAR